MLSVEVRVEGVSSWIPHASDSKYLVVFPQAGDEVNRSSLGRAQDGSPLCKHRLFVQCRLENLGIHLEPLSTLWATWYLDRVRLSFDTGRTIPILTGSPDHLPKMAEILPNDRERKLHPTVTTRGNELSRHVAGQLLVDRGSLKRDAVRGTRATFGTGYGGIFSNTTIIELDPVETFSLRVEHLDTGKTEPLPFSFNRNAPSSRLRVWVRNVCDATPQPLQSRALNAGPAVSDDDFRLLYPLREIYHDDLDKARDDLPVPVLDLSQVGSPRQCMGACENAQSF